MSNHPNRWVIWLATRKTARQADPLAGQPRTHTPRALIAAEYEFLHAAGVTDQRIATQIGITHQAMERALQRCGYRRVNQRWTKEEQP